MNWTEKPDNMLRGGTNHFLDVGLCAVAGVRNLATPTWTASIWLIQKYTKDNFTTPEEAKAWCEQFILRELKRSAIKAGILK